MHSVIHGWWVLSEDAAEVLFAAVGAYSILANYAGDNKNLPSTSNTLSIAITIPDFTLTADRTEEEIAALAAALRKAAWDFRKSGETVD